MFPEQEPGAAVLIMQGNDIVFDKGYGIADINTKKPIDGNTFFNIASVSKQFTATAILQLAEKGKIALEDPVNKYYPEFKQDFWKGIKIKQRLSHSSGIPDARNASIPHTSCWETWLLKSAAKISQAIWKDISSALPE